MLEKERFPREHIGESVIPSVVPLLNRLGVRDKMDAEGYLRKRGTTFVWGKDEEPWTVYFVEANPRIGYSYQLWRPYFDQMLLDNAAEKGATLRHEHTVLSLIERDGRVVGVHYKTPEGDERDLYARIVVDASGQSALVARSTSSTGRG